MRQAGKEQWGGRREVTALRVATRRAQVATTSKAATSRRKQPANNKNKDKNAKKKKNQTKRKHIRIVPRKKKKRKDRCKVDGREEGER